MKFSTLFVGGLASIASAQTPGPYTDPKSGITFSYLVGPAGYFFGIAAPASGSNTDFIGTIGGKGSGWSGASLGGTMLSKLLIVAWPNGQSVLGSFRKTAQYGSPAVATGSFTQTPIANGTYINSTHWTYTFLCSKCILTDGSTFEPSAGSPSIGWAYSATGPTSKANAGSAVPKHSDQGTAIFQVKRADVSEFDLWKSWAEKEEVEESEE